VSGIEREKEREPGTERERMRELGTERESVCVCEREREREREQYLAGTLIGKGGVCV